MTGMATFQKRADLLAALSGLGFSIEPRRPTRDTAPRRTLVRLHGRVFADITARPTQERMIAIYQRALAEVRKQGLPEPPVVDGHTRLVHDSHQEDDVVPEGVPLSTLRKAALVDSLGQPRAIRVRAYIQYREVYRERFDRYPGENELAGNRPILGRCPRCEQPQELDCLSDCPMVDPMTATPPPATPPRRTPRPWSKGWKPHG